MNLFFVGPVFETSEAVDAHYAVVLENAVQC